MQRTDLPVESSVDDLQTLTASWRRHLRAANLAPKTIRTYLKAADGLRSFPAERGMPTAVAAIRREHVEAYVELLLERWKPATASVRYRRSNSCSGS